MVFEKGEPTSLATVVSFDSSMHVMRGMVRMDRWGEEFPILVTSGFSVNHSHGPSHLPQVGERIRVQLSREWWDDDIVTYVRAWTFEEEWKSRKRDYSSDDAPMPEWRQNILDKLRAKAQGMSLSSLDVWEEDLLPSPYPEDRQPRYFSSDNQSAAGIWDSEVLSLIREVRNQLPIKR